MSEYTTKELEEKFGVKIKFFDPEEESFWQTSYYDPEADTIILNKYLSGKAKLVDLAHEIGHKRHVDELREKGVRVTGERPKVEDECQAWKRGLDIAKGLGIVEAYKKRWRGAWFPVCVTCYCPYPGDDKVPSDFSIGEKADYSLKEWMKLMDKYIRTGKWLGTKHLGVTEHIT